jgi:methylmalonyl-CoA mutase, N-terminal domain
LPTEDAARIALRTQQVIAHESGVAHIVDALGGSYAIEFLTNEIEQRAAEYITKIDEMGGMLAAIEAHYVQREIERAAYDYQKAVEAQTAIVVGVNKFAVAEDAPIPTLKIDPATEEAQRLRVQKVRTERNSEAAMKALAEVESAAKSGENLMPRIITAVESYATLGEIADAMRRVFGEYQDSM